MRQKRTAIHFLLSLFLWQPTLLVSCFESTRDRPFLLKMVPYLEIDRLKYKRNLIPRVPIQSKMLVRPGNSEKTCGIFFLFALLILVFWKYETIVSINGLSLGYSEQGTCSVASRYGNFSIAYTPTKVHQNYQKNREFCYIRKRWEENEPNDWSWLMNSFGLHLTCPKNKIIGKKNLPKN